ncbi:MAG: DUF4402 domain-containing protein [Sphingomonadales bacterium]|nr:DUF4402 domain-containing protein [Sphingomonadales bacterium]
MGRSLALLIAALLLPAAPALGQEACRLCYADPMAKPGERPLTIEIWADLSFAKLALVSRSGGSAQVDAHSGGKSTQGDLIDLGGSAVSGRGRITGTPLRRVRIDLPARVPMTTPDGAVAELTDFTTNLPADPQLDANGELEFTFGARMTVKNGRGGNYRGRIPISVDYN